MKSRKLLCTIFSLILIFTLTGCATKKTVNTEYYMTIGDYNIEYIEINGGKIRGACCKDGGVFEKGEEVLVETLNNLDSLKGITFTAYDIDYTVLWSYTVTDDVTSLQDGNWIIRQNIN